MNLNFGEVLATSWKTVWRHKILFVFGLLPMSISALVGIVMGGAFIYLDVSGTDIDRLFQFGPTTEISIFVIVVFSLLIMLLSFGLTSISWAAIAVGTTQVDRGQDTLTFNSLWRDSFPFFWRVIGAFFLIGFLSFIVMMFVMMIPLGLSIITAGLGALCMLPFICLMIPFAFLIGAMLNLSISSIVVDDINLTGAITRVWNIVLKNFWLLVLMSLILYVIQFFISMVSSAPFSMFQYGFMGFMNEQTNPTKLFKFFGILSMISTPILAFIQGLGYTYIQSAWTLTYLRLTQKPETSESPASVEPVNA